MTGLLKRYYSTFFVERSTYIVRARITDVKKALSHLLSGAKTDMDGTVRRNKFEMNQYETWQHY